MRIANGEILVQGPTVAPEAVADDGWLHTGDVGRIDPEGFLWVEGRRDDVITAFQADVIASCVGPVTAAAFEMWGVPTVFPERSRLAAMVKQLETELPSRRDGLSLELVDGQLLLLHGDDVLLDGVPVRLSPAPTAVLQALVANPGNVVSRRALLAMLPSGTAGSEHAVEMAVARLRAALGTRSVQTVVKRGYRLAVAP